MATQIAIQTLHNSVEWCNLQTKQTGNEAMRCIDANSGEILYETIGDKNEVRMDADLHDRPNTLCLHSHPIDMVPSTQDIMMTTANCFTGFVCTPDGSLYRTKGFLPEDPNWKDNDERKQIPQLLPNWEAELKFQILGQTSEILVASEARGRTINWADPHNWADDLMALPYVAYLQARALGWIDLDAYLAPKSDEQVAKWLEVLDLRKIQNMLKNQVADPKMALAANMLLAFDNVREGYLRKEQ